MSPPYSVFAKTRQVSIMRRVDRFLSEERRENFYDIKLWGKGKGKGKGKTHPRTGNEAPEGEKRYSSTLSLTSALDGVGS